MCMRVGVHVCVQLVCASARARVRVRVCSRVRVCAHLCTCLHVYMGIRARFCGGVVVRLGGRGGLRVCRCA